MSEARHPFGGAGDQRRPELRSDLRVINDASGDGAMRVIDPRNGRQYSFDQPEQGLWRAADGSADIADIHARHRAEGGDMTEDEVAKFFRRLHVLGLLKPSQPDPEDAKAASPSASRLVARRREERAKGAPERAGAPAKSGPGGLMARRRLDRAGAAVSAEGARGKVPGAMRERLARRAPPDEVDPAKPRELLSRRRREMLDKEQPDTPVPAPATKEPSPAVLELRARRARDAGQGPHRFRR